MIILTILGWILFGLIVGFIARALVPGKDNIGFLATIALGVLGSIVGGVLALGALWLFNSVYTVGPNEVGVELLFGKPKQGFGFSRNPRMRMGPPRYEECRIAVTGASMREAIQIKYLL